MLLALLLSATLFLAWSNGANDNFKGVATLWGSRTATFRQALTWATGGTVLGSLVSVAIAGTLVARFSGKGVVEDSLIDPKMLTAIGAAGAITIFLATLLRMPTSTTHALTGALVGAGWVAAGASNLDWGVLGTKFAQPLLLSPALAILGTATIYPGLRRARRLAGIDRETCLCVGTEDLRPVAIGTAAAIDTTTAPGVTLGTTAACTERYRGSLLGLDAQTAVDAVHYLSAGAVCFARAVNDTPKIAALLLAAGGIAGGFSTLTLLGVAIAMAAGGWVQSRGVAETMSLRITQLNPGQGLTANLLTAFLVLGASRLGLPVSTTHVSCGSIFGIGIATRTADRGIVFQIFTTWVTTLPLGLLLGALCYRGLTALGS